MPDSMAERFLRWALFAALVGLIAIRVAGLQIGV
jgi:hypothetical protein